MNASPRWDVEGHDWPNRDAGRFVTVGGLRWHVQVMGRGPAALLIHGTGAATHSWRDLAPALAGDFTVVAPDLPGHGFTAGRAPGGATMISMARAIAALLDTLGLPPALVIGHSAGAAIAARMAIDRLAAPRAIVGLDAALLPFPGLAAALFPTLARLLFVNPFAPHIFARIARVPGEAERFLRRSTGSAIDARGVDLYARLFASPAHCAGAIAMMADWDLESLARDLPRLATPLLLIHGRSDAAIPIADAERAAAMVRRGQFRAIAGGHLAHEEHPAETAALISELVAASGAI